MSEALLVSVIQKLDMNYQEFERNEGMEMVIKEMKEILDIVRDKRLEEGRTLNFLVYDLVEMADCALHRREKGYTYLWKYESIYSWIGEIKKHILKLGDEMESNIRSSENIEDDVDVVGLEKDVEMLLRKIIIGGKGYFSWIVVIKGMCGIGKTTLARQIYNHPTVIQLFDTRAWVSNSTSTYFSTMKELLIKVIQQLQDPENLHTSSLLENMDNRSLRDMLSQHLRGKRYLIVLDDVPKQMRFKSFLEVLRQDNGSRLLLTSHTMNADLHVDDGNVHEMKPLDSKKSWQLFLKTINHGNKLRGEHKFPMGLEHMGKQMLRKCDGLPLAIKEVGKQLAEKKLSGGSEWEQLLESVDFGSTLKLLEPFYNQLALGMDPKVQSCFLGMAFFKANTTLRKEKLKQIWVAGGVVDSAYNCESYLRGLINESVIEAKEKSTKYYMNGVLHMLSIQKAEEELGFEIIRNNGNNRPYESPRYHRVIICSRDKFNYSTDQDKHLVSLFFHGGGYLDTSPSYWKSFELLKILDLEDFGLKFLLETIVRLMELIYLGLRNNYIKELPESLGCLKKLEVLDIAQNFMVEVPDIIWKMYKLRHLYMSDVICQKPLKIDELQHLETLTYISVDNWTYGLSRLRLLFRLTKLGIEGLDGNSDVSKLFASLAQLRSLEHLILRGYRFRSMPCLDKLGILQSVRTLKLDGLLARLPTSFPPNIGSLTLVNSCLDEDPMPLLGKLGMLYYLKLRNAYTGQQMVILPEGFPHLKVLCIEELWNLRNIQCAEDAMNWLEKLEIQDCPYLDTLPKAIGLMKYLKELKMVTTESIATKMRNTDLISDISIVNINS
ncbi:disease resistance RPP8-like protein 3 [Salvia miltiorrhiza]|uniref:disease resistance RPP8-like protein 3 n=1 Tax=Salvia miltiorrhiza TaxID=226208 RepID=UPI0025ABB623|nr:disease resistance RPP8-like protein 3 [Salvia miltiorrhiza]XP_057802279.1 disease resistance RPP8-like protein 3 [Salvia miltiorrhiza]XP_057802280.1 disease resistance RPP8-like protein 3 [Salvia miltiorrhiza]XP_057802281.1 disease resistance RPP8-like protein 3 [Salvia miltiorrhiza]